MGEGEAITDSQQSLPYHQQTDKFRDASAPVTNTVPEANSTAQQPAANQATNVQTATLPANDLPAEQPEVTKPAEVKPEKPLSKAAYVVKVGSFSKEQNANALVARLKAAGHSAFTRKIVNSQGTTMVSVLVGPDLKKDKLEAKLSELQQLSQVPKLKVTSYQPIEN